MLKTSPATTPADHDKGFVIGDDEKYLIQTGDAHESEYIINSGGVVVRTMHFDKKSKKIATKCEKKYTWDEFAIVRGLVDDKARDYELHYDFRYNGHLYSDKSLREMNEIVSETSLLDARGSKSKQMFNALVDIYFKGEKIPIVVYDKIIGFDDGWKLPDDGKHHFRAPSGLFDKEFEELKMLANMPYDREKSLKTFNLIRESMSIRQRDWFIALGIARPFHHALRKHVNLLPWASACQPGGGSGTTSAFLVTTKKFWRVPTRIFNSMNVESTKRIEHYVSFSTFAVIFDDVEKMDDKGQGMIKSYCTFDTDTSKLNPDQTVKVNRPLCSPVNMTFNSAPSMYMDIPFLQRGQHCEMDGKVDPARAATFNKVLEDPGIEGDVGRAVIEFTRDWNDAKLFEVYDSMPGLPGADSRQDVIWKEIMLGAWLAEQVFSVKLDTSYWKQIVTETVNYGSTNVIELVQEICQETTDENGHVPKWLSILVPCDAKNNRIFGIVNLNDLNTQLKKHECPPITNLPKLVTILRKAWPDVVYDQKKRYKIDGKPLHGIFIPSSRVEMKKDEPRKDKMTEDWSDFPKRTAYGAKVTKVT